MANKTFNGRIVHKHDIEANWKLATNFIPKQGELIVYDIDDNYDYERMKIGDGKTVVTDLPFIEASKADHATEATHAELADKATEADHATSADKATSSDSATHAETADSATDADTVDGKHASDFASATDFNNLSSLVGDTSVADQISAAVTELDEAKVDKTNLFIGTYAEYQEAYANGEIAIGALVCITDDGISTTSELGTAIIGHMVLL